MAPKLSVSVSLIERSVFLGQLPLFSDCNLMIGSIIQTLYFLRVGKVMTSLGLTLKRALLLQRNMVTVLKSSWQKQHPGEGGLTKALGMGVGGGGCHRFCQRMALSTLPALWNPLGSV